jgi:hypothetical protein
MNSEKSAAVFDCRTKRCLNRKQKIVSWLVAEEEDGDYWVENPDSTHHHWSL